MTDITVRRDSDAGGEYSPPDPDDEIIDAEVIDDPPAPREVRGTDGKRPTPVMAPNKTLAAQLATEFRGKGLLDQRRGRAVEALGDQQPAHPT